MRIAVCDDCQEDALQLKAFLKGNEVRVYLNAKELLDDIEKNNNSVYGAASPVRHYDLFLLDIFIENSMNGIELARRIRMQDAEAVICFVSTSNDFYREAYDLYAVQYLLKPLQEEDIQRLLNRVERSFGHNRERSLVFKGRKRAGTISYSNILYISSREHTLSIHCKDGQIQECIGKLSELALQLDGDIFCRCHQSFLVNMYQVDGMRKNELDISGEKIPISRRYYTEVKRQYQEILFEEVD